MGATWSDVPWQEIDDLSGGAVPMRVVCTGYGIGGFSRPSEDLQYKRFECKHL